MSAPGDFVRAYLFIFRVPLSASREMEAMDRASSQCLVAGPLTVARTCGKMAPAALSFRALGSDSDQACVGSAWSMKQWQQQGRCVPRGVRATTGFVRL